MQRIFLIVLGCLISSLPVFSQNGDLFVKFGSKGLYLEHKVGAKENFYSISRMYLVHPRSIASYNGLDMSKGLSLDQVINIPLTDTNLNRKKNEGSPVFYQPMIRQTAASISALSKTPLENIRKWNNLADDKIGPGSKVIIGYLLPAAEIKVAKTAPVIKPETTAVLSPVEKPEEPAEKKEAAVTGSQREIILSETAQPAPGAVSAGGEGYFRDHFIQQVKKYPLSKDQTLSSGMFKTTSGWADGKYYALIDGVEPGMIIQVMNPSNNKTVYAKVLGPVSGIRQNQGLNLRLSNAAVTALALPEAGKFMVKVNY
ncbi:MAG: LysM peptidoglycan-binding domain-containing protein [Luteolibacter sp.]